MSRVAKEIGRGFKKVANEILNFFDNEIVQTVIIAVAAYYTMGAAFGAMGGAQAAGASTASTVAGGGAAGASGAMSTAVVTGAQASPMWIGGAAGASSGVGGTLAGIEGLVAAGNASIAGAGSLVAGASGGAAVGGAAAGGLLSEVIPTVAERTTQFAQPSAWDKIAGFGKDVGGKIKSGWSGMNAMEKINMAKMGVDVVGAMTGPTPEDIYNAKYAAENKWRGAFYGETADSVGGGGMSSEEMSAARANLGAPDTVNRMGSTQAPSEAMTGAGVPPQNQNVAPGPRSAQPTQIPNDLFADPLNQRDDSEETPMLFGEGQMKQMIPVPHDVFAPTPGVRYI